MKALLRIGEQMDRLAATLADVLPEEITSHQHEGLVWTRSGICLTRQGDLGCYGPSFWIEQDNDRRLISGQPEDTFCLHGDSHLQISTGSPADYITAAQEVQPFLLSLVERLGNATAKTTKALRVLSVAMATLKSHHRKEVSE